MTPHTAQPRGRPLDGRLFIDKPRNRVFYMPACNDGTPCPLAMSHANAVMSLSYRRFV